MVRNIIFDVGYVLIDYSWKDKFREWYDEEGVARLARTLFGEGIPDSERGLWIRYDNGLISDEEIRETCLRHLPDDRMALEWFFDNTANWCSVLHDMADLIRPLKEKGYSVYLLSNYPELLWKQHVCRQDFYPLLDGEVVSWQEHYGKPEERFFRRLLEKYDLKAEECIFLDDRADNTQAAEEIGFHTITLNSPGKREEAVRYLTALPKLE
ncbi:MAG: HAD family phosphatase [Lachnospiraceae bacterium]|nr:HAD family phosphatase [Lachnospiraceae bacterium]